MCVTILSSCYYDNEEDLYRSEEMFCDTLNISFSDDIIPIIDNSCISCHGNVTAPALGGNIFLHNYFGVKTSVDNGSLIGSIKYLPGYNSMPIDYKLDECTIKKINAWINNDAPNN